MSSRIQTIIENEKPIRQLLYGSVLGIFFLLLTWLVDTHSFLAVLAVSVIATAKEHYMDDINGQFNYRNLLLLLFPIIVLHIIIHW